MTERVYAVVIGAGQAGLSTSYYLTRFGIEHVVLEKSSIAHSWKQRWDSFSLVTPNRLNALPDFPSGGEPFEFLTRAEVVTYLETFAARFNPTVRTGVTVTGVTREPDDTFRVDTNTRPIYCHAVVVATNIFQHPRPPAMSAQLSPHVVQMHSDRYRNPDQLPPGPVLVVGSGQSGMQIADELYHAGRQVILSVSRAGRLPRRFRGRDIMDWIRIFRGWERTVDQLESPRDRTAARPHVTGQRGGQTLNLRSFGRAGIRLLGKVSGGVGDEMYFADDLEENMRRADEFAKGLCTAINMAIDKLDIEADELSAEDLAVETWAPTEVPGKLSLRDAGVSTVVWATGYPFDFTWIRGLEVDDYHYPVHERGVTRMPGVYFASLPWLHKHKSSSLYGAGEDAEFVARHLAERAGVKL